MRLALAPIILACVACSDDLPSVSTDVSSRDIAIAMSLSGTPSSTVVSGRVSGPRGAPLRLIEGDSLELRAPFAVISLAVSQGSFSSTLPAFGGNVALALLRPPGRGGDLGGAWVLATPFALTAPTTASRAATLSVTWEAATGPYATTIGVAGPCVLGVSRMLASDVGAYAFNPYELASSAAATGTCTVTVEIVKG
ncbi:hypothetical protein BH09MYX1_BH09MYX1_60880 [soil metagenome]